MLCPSMLFVVIVDFHRFSLQWKTNYSGNYYRTTLPRQPHLACIQNSVFIGQRSRRLSLSASSSRIWIWTYCKSHIGAYLIVTRSWAESQAQLNRLHARGKLFQRWTIPVSWLAELVLKHHVINHCTLDPSKIVYQSNLGCRQMRGEW